jgi:hypothetical protein
MAARKPDNFRLAYWPMGAAHLNHQTITILLFTEPSTREKELEFGLSGLTFYHYSLHTNYNILNHGVNPLIKPSHTTSPHLKSTNLPTISTCQQQNQ